MRELEKRTKKRQNEKLNPGNPELQLGIELFTTVNCSKDENKTKPLKVLAKLELGDPRNWQLKNIFFTLYFVKSEKDYEHDYERDYDFNVQRF